MENYQIIAFATSLVIFMTYVLWVWVKYGVQPSISESFYKINGNWKWMFTLALWGFSFPLTVVGVELHPIFFFATVAIMFTGAAPAFKGTKMQHDVHVIGAVLGVILSVVGLVLIKEFIPAIIGISAIIAMYLSKVKNLTWWVEAAAYFMSFGGLLSAVLN